MALTKVQKSAIIKDVAGNEKDTGKTESQIAILTKDIALITEHVKIAKKDYSSKRGLYQKVSKRKALLNYLKRTDIERYRAIVKKLDLRN
ncbi:MAG: 30S ribosomal protein S15 [Mycoplasmoidaceae bacterium]|nr:MAG: 30S ribosomal protein S15 [Mycoplasmoidaceae bacterium]